MRINPNTVQIEKTLTIGDDPLPLGIVRLINVMSLALYSMSYVEYGAVLNGLCLKLPFVVFWDMKLLLKL